MRCLASPILLSLLVLPACIVIENDPANGDPPADSSAVIITDACPGFPVGAVDSADVVDDTLIVAAHYGGCGATELYACWDGSFLESFPVQVPIAIHHADAGDCDAWIGDEAAVSLRPVIDAYRDAYGSTDPMILRVDEHSPRWEP